jgi:hypothetical protein
VRAADGPTRKRSHVAHGDCARNLLIDRYREGDPGRREPPYRSLRKVRAHLAGQATAQASQTWSSE